jgi:hypothetical protein
VIVFLCSREVQGDAAESGTGEPLVRERVLNEQPSSNDDCHDDARRKRPLIDAIRRLSCSRRTTRLAAPALPVLLGRDQLLERSNDRSIVQPALQPLRYLLNLVVVLYDHIQLDSTLAAENKAGVLCCCCYVGCVRKGV